jgi:hypothetical protein
VTRPLNNFGYAMTLEEIGRQTGQSKKAVAMMIKTALSKIRQRDRSLEEFRRLVALRRAVAERRDSL